MKLLGIPYNKFLFHLLSFNLNGLLVFGAYLLYYYVMVLIFPKFPYGGKGYSNELMVFNIFIISFFTPFLIYIVKNHKFHLFLIIIIEIIFFGLVIFLYFNGHGEKLNGFYHNVLISAPYIIIISILIYVVQLILGKKLLPTKYKNNKGFSA